MTFRRTFVMLDVELWEVFKDMYEAYEKGWTYYAHDRKKDQQEKKKKRENFSIGWLKPLLATCDANFIFFLLKRNSIMTKGNLGIVF
jgi:hypothetical protein